MNGLDLCRKIRSKIKDCYTYIILLTAKTHRHERLQGLSASADDFLVKPIDQPELEIASLRPPSVSSRHKKHSIARTRELERVNQDLLRQAEHDELTGLKNQKGFQDSLAIAMRQARDDQLPVSLMRFELDHPERLDEALSQSALHDMHIKIANRLRTESRECDIAARRTTTAVTDSAGTTSDWALPVADNLRALLAEIREGRGPPDGELRHCLSVPPYGSAAELVKCCVCA